MAVDIFGFESKLYPRIDASGMRGEFELKEKFMLGDDQFVEVSIKNFEKNPLNLYDIVDSRDIQFRANFWKDKKSWLRIDNDHGFLHLHLELNEEKFCDHQTIELEFILMELISHSFKLCRKFLKEKHPSSEIQDSRGFVGSA